MFMFKQKLIARSVMLAVSGTFAATSAFAQTDPQKIEKIEITGSSIKRIEGEGALPVTVIKREDIERSGATNAVQILEKLSSNNGGGYNAAQSLGDTARSGLSAASLRGLGAGRTLVLLNGRRMSVYAFGGTGVDLKAIPLSAIDRIEILRDGASAVYGSDAIGGVINFITRKDFTGGEAAIGYEQPEKKGGEVMTVNGTVGFGDLAKDRFNVLAMLDYQDNKRVKAADRDFARTGIVDAIGAVKTSGNTFPANIRRADTGAALKNPSFDAGCNPPTSVYLSGNFNCRYDFTNKIDIALPFETTSAFARGVYQINQDNQVFGEFSYSRNKLEIAVAETPTITTGKPSYRYPAGGKYYPQSVVAGGYTGDLFVSWRTVDGGRRTNQVTSDQSRILLGADGVIAGWDYKAGLSRAEAKATDNYVNGYFSDPLLRAALATGKVNPFGPNDAEGLALLNGAKILQPVRISKTSSDVFDLKGSRELMALPGGPLGVAAGYEFRKEKYNDGYQPIFSSGNIIGGSGDQQPVAGDRRINALFAELNIPFLKQWEAQLAVRHDRFSDFGSTTNPKAAIRYQPTKQLLFRASAGTGFRAPTLDDLYSPQSGTNSGGNYNDPFYDALVGCEKKPDINRCDAQLDVRQGGNSKLQPEKSKQFTIGALFEPTTDWSIGVDYFEIRMKNNIVAISGDDILNDFYNNQTGPGTSSGNLANRLIKNAAGYLDYVQAGQENAGELEVAGFDISIKGAIKTAFGTFRPELESTYLTKDKSRLTIDPALTSNLGRYAQSGPSVRYKQVFTVGWERGPWVVTAQHAYQTGYLDYSGERNVSSYDLVNLNVQWKGIKNLTVTGGVRNVFDKKPPLSDQDDYFQVGFDPTYADVKGRAFYVKLGYKFF
jgi:iron complex outermembrane recepter protein